MKAFIVIFGIDREPGSIGGVFSNREDADAYAAEVNDPWLITEVREIEIDHRYKPLEIRA